MSTHCLIAKKTGEDQYKAVYCHFDGYPEGVGKTLGEHYTTEEKVDQLLSLGDISSLGEIIGEKHDFDHSPDRECNAYYRDRGEEWEDVQPETMSLQDLKSSDRGEYVYVYDESHWQLL